MSLLAPFAAPEIQVLMPLLLVFGVGTEAPSLYSAIIAKVKSNFFRRSGVRNAEAKALSTDPPADEAITMIALLGYRLNSFRYGKFRAARETQHRVRLAHLHR